MMVEPLQIAGLRVPESLPPVLLAPMSGVSDLPFRRLVRRMFDGLVFSEMIAGRELLRGTARSGRMVLFDDDERCRAVQIAGRDPALMADAARCAVDYGADLVDINFGCPMKKVVNGLGGAAILKDEPLAVRILEAVVGAVRVPVTLKMRLGWDAGSMNAPRIAHLAEASGVCMITVHGRTREQMYRGRADWLAVRAVSERIEVPLVVNGDIACVGDARTALAQSGAVAVMVGRAACGRPWLPGGIAQALATGTRPPVPSAGAMLEIVLAHYDDMLGFYGVDQGLRIARKHLAWYLRAWPDGRHVARRLAACERADEVRRALRAFYEGLTTDRGLAA